MSDTLVQIKDFDAFFFDLDGTFIEGSDKHFVMCVHETAKEFGKDDIHIPPGHGLKNFVRESFPHEGDDFIDLFYQKNKQRMLRTDRPVSFHDDALKFINHYDSVPRALVTNCHAWELELTTNALDLEQYFQNILCNGPDISGKPAGDLYLEASKMVNIPPSKCLVFEDSPTGIQSGKNAGMTVVAIDRNMHHRFEGADCVVQSFLELL